MDDKGYAKRSIAVNGRQRPLRLHRAIMGMPVVSDGREVDHIDRTPLHCCRSNLRVLLRTGRQNGQNKSSHRGASSQYRGVSWHKGSQSWQARITVDQRTICLGRFTDEREAAEVARAARARLMPYAVD